MSPAAAATSRKITPGLRLIVADDNHDAATGLAMILREEGHEVLEVYRGDAVITFAATFHPDALILDIGMPGLTGFEIAHELRRTLGAACPLLIAVTAWNQPAARELGRASGFSHYLTKPYSTDELLAILSSVSPRGPAGRP
jgi:DNA-binding response OmpR family regulator